MSQYVPELHVHFVSHVGICVADIGRAKRFYMEGLGFQEGALLKVEDRCHGLLGIPESLLMHNQFLRHGNAVIELIQFDRPALLPTTTPRPMNCLGLTHLSFRVRDIDTVAKRLAELGGNILDSTRTVEDQVGPARGYIIFCTDPDGTRIELMDFPDEVSFA